MKCYHKPATIHVETDAALLAEIAAIIPFVSDLEKRLQTAPVLKSIFWNFSEAEVAGAIAEAIDHGKSTVILDGSPGDSPAEKAAAADAKARAEAADAKETAEKLKAEAVAKAETKAEDAAAAKRQKASEHETHAKAKK